MRYVQRFGDEHQNLLKDVSKMREQLDDTVKSSFRNERALMGGWSDDGQTYITGIRAQTWWIKPMAIGIWTVVIALIPVVANNIMHLVQGR